MTMIVAWRQEERPSQRLCATFGMPCKGADCEDWGTQKELCAAMQVLSALAGLNDSQKPAMGQCMCFCMLPKLPSRANRQAVLSVHRLHLTEDVARQRGPWDGAFNVLTPSSVDLQKQKGGLVHSKGEGHQQAACCNC